MLNSSIKPAIERMLEKTILNEKVVSGVGLHSGQEINLRFKPADKKHGVVFKKKKDGKEILIPALYSSAKESNLCTLLESDGEKVHTIEHLMSALNALDIDNILIEIDGDEVPILDGSAMPFIDVLENCGTQFCDSHREYIQILKPFSVTDGDKTVSLSPSSDSSFSYHIDFQNYPIIGKQNYSSILTKQNNINEISYARTFGFYEQVPELLNKGLVKGGSLDNAIVLDKDGNVMNKSGLRHKEEFVRHKVLDAIGDIKLAGKKILGHFKGIKASHLLTLRLIQCLYANPQLWKVVVLP